jgi:hypothetical protein
MVAELTQWFDVVVFDPRGMGESGGVSCPSAAPQPSLLSPPERGAPSTRTPRRRNSSHVTARRPSARCTTRWTRGRWPTTWTPSAPRSATGNSPTSATPTAPCTGRPTPELFGANVERMYLDSVADHTAPDLYGMVEPKAVALEANLHEFVEWCAQDPTCALHTEDAPGQGSGHRSPECPHRGHRGAMLETWMTETVVPS